MFTDKIELKDFEKQDPEYQDLLRRVLAIQADCEIGGPNLYVKDILPNAPTKLDQLIVARTAAEEMDHFRKMARLAGDIGVDVSYTLSRPNQERYVEAFRGQIKTWEDFAVFGFLSTASVASSSRSLSAPRICPSPVSSRIRTLSEKKKGMSTSAPMRRLNLPRKVENIKNEFKKR